MDEFEPPENKMSLADARLSWALSFLTDWIIPLLDDNRIKDASEIAELFEDFPPIQIDDVQGVDFTLNDVLTAALQWKDYEEKLHPHIPVTKLKYGKAFLKAIELVTELLDPPDKSEKWTQKPLWED